MTRRKRLILERLEDRILLNAAVPTATLDLPAEDFVNEAFDFAVSFDNGAAAGPGSTGFAPYVDLAIDSDINANGVSISLLGAAVQPLLTATFDGTQWLDGGGLPVTEHPLTRQALDGTDALTAGAAAGDQLLIVQLPFGSFTADQPLARLEFTGLGLGGAVGTPNPVVARGGFAFGCDEFDNPGTDPALVQAPQSATITPTVLELTKVNDAPEGETATGPNYPRTYTLEVDIATGETVTDLVLQDTLPAASAYIDSLTFVAGGTPGVNSVPIVDTDGPLLSLDYGFGGAGITGVAGPDIIVTYQLYIPDVIADTDGNDNDQVAAANPFVNAARVDAVYLGSPLADTATVDLTGKLVAVQKGVSVLTDVEGNGPTPGDTLRYTLDFQVSDFTDLSSVTLTDVVGNGLAVDTAFVPTFTVNENGTTTSGSFMLTSAANAPFTGNIVQTDLGGGVTRLVFDLSQELVDRGQDGTLAASPLSPATTGTITFRARILESYTAPGPGGDLSVDLGDSLSNDVIISGTTSGGDIESDTGAATLTVPGITLDKSIFAVFDPALGTPIALDPAAGLSPGLAVTYRIEVDLPTADIENFVLTDFLPLPVFSATSVTAFSNSFNAIGVPAVGQFGYGPAHTLNAQTFNSGTPNDPPTLATDGVSNTLTFAFGTFDAAPPSGPVTVDLLFTVALLDKPFGDGLNLTNQSVSQFGNTAGTSVASSEIVQIVLNQPELALTKGVVATDQASAVFDAATGPVAFAGPGAADPFTTPFDAAALAATPIDANISAGLDAGDRVTFALVVANSGGAAAFDIVLRDTIPAGFQVPAGGPDIQVRSAADGTTPIGFVDVGAGLFSTTPGEGIRVDDGASGALTSRSGAAGSNLLVVTYELEATGATTPATLYENTAFLESYGGREGGTDFTAGFDRPEYEDVASVITTVPAVDKVLVATDRAFTDGTDATIGEVLTYDLVVTLPEGTIDDLVITDLVPAGLALSGVPVLVTGAAGSTALDLDFAGTINLVSAVSGGLSGDDIVFTLDDGAGGAVLVNGDNVAANNRFVLRFDTVVADVPGNVGLAPQTTLTNNARLDYTDPDGSANNGVSGPGDPLLSPPVVVTVVEPLITIDKAIDLDSVDAGDVISVTLTLNNSGTADAFDIDIQDLVDPVKFTNVVAGAAPAGFVNNSAGSTIRYTQLPNTPLAEGAPPVLFTFSAEVTGNIQPGEILSNTAVVTAATSLPGGGRDASGDTGTDTAQVELGLTKSIVGTSESHTGSAGGATRLAIGEVVRYRLLVELPESNALDFTLQDLLPTGLNFIDPQAALDSSVRIAFVSDGGLSSSGPLATFGPGAFIVGDETTIGAITPTFVVADANISNTPDADADTYVSGADVYFRLGDILNADRDANKEYIVVEFNAYANNITANQASATRANSFRALSDDLGPNTQIGSDSAAVNVRLSEPAINVQKQLMTTPVDAGDTVVYDIVVTNAGVANVTSGFDVRVVDDLDALDPGRLTLGSVQFLAGTTGAVLSNVASAGNVIDVTIDRLDAGEAVTLRVTGTLAADVPAGLQLDNRADLTYTSLPGTNGTAGNPTGSLAPGVPGAGDGERSGAGGARNDYFGASTIAFGTPAPTIDKRLLDETATTATIGDSIVYDIVVTLPEGRTDDLRLADAVPAGLAVAGAELVTSAAGSPYLAADFAGTIQNAATIAAVVPQDNGVDLALDLGDVDVPATPGTAGNQFVVRVTAVALNDPATSGLSGTQRAFTNAASALYLDPDDGAGNTPVDVTVDDPTDPTVTAVEPELLVSKNISVAAGDAGDAATWTITVAHSAASTATAFDLDLTDTLPAAFSPSGFTAQVGAADVATLFNLAGANLTTVGDLDLALGEVLAVTISGTFNAATAPGSTVSNGASLTYGSGDGTVSDLLGGAGGPNDAQDDERITTIGAGASLAVPLPTFDKVLLATDEAATSDALGEVTIGETVTYGLVLTLPEGTYTELVVDDDIPLGLDYVGGSAVIVPAAGYAGGPLPAVAVAGGVGSGADVTFTLAAPFSVAGDNDPANNAFTLQYQAIVVDAGNAGLAGGQTVLSNAAAVTLDDPDNPGTPLPLEVTGQPGITSDAITLTVVEPQLQIDKRSVVTRADAGDVVTYTVTVSHTAQSTTSAFDLVVNDQLLGIVFPAPGPPGADKLDLVGTPTVTTTAGTFAIGTSPPGDQQIQVLIDRFDRTDAPILITYSALLNGNVIAAGDSVTNTADVSFDSHGDNPTEQRSTGPVSDSHTILVPLAAPELDKSVIATSLPHTGNDRLDPALVDLVVGETVTYRLVATFNEGSYGGPLDPTVDAVLSDQLPDYLALVGAPRIVTGGSNGVGSNVTLISSNVTTADNNADLLPDFFSIDLNLDNVAIGAASPALINDQIHVEFDARVLDVDDGTTNRNANVLTNTATLLFDPTGGAITTMAAADVEIVEPELVVTKTVDNATPQLGDTVTYTVTVAHAPGPNLPTGSGTSAYDVVIDDPLAPELALVAGSVAVVESPAGLATSGLVLTSGNAPGDTRVTLRADSLALLNAPDGQLVITFDAVVTADPAGFGQVVINTATAGYDGIPGDAPNQRVESVTDTETVRIVGPDLDVTKTDSAAVTTPGSALTYTIDVSNKAAPGGDPLNAAPATNVVVVDTLPLGVTFVSSPDASFVAFDPATREARWLIPALAPGAAVTVTVNATVDSPAPAGVEILSNSVTVGADEFEPTPGDNTASDNTFLDAAPDLFISKSDGRSDVSPGDGLTYSIVVGNAGTQSASGVVVTDTFPPSLYGAVAAPLAPGVATVAVDPVSGVITWRIDQLGGGQTLNLTVNARVANPVAAGVAGFTNTVTVGDDGTSGPDANPGDETASDANVLVGAVPDYRVTKSNATDTLVPGSATTWTIAVTNAGNRGGTGVTVVDTFDPALLFDVAASDGGVVDSDSGTITWTLGGVEGGGSTRLLSVTATVVQVPPAGQQTNVNTVAVSDDGANGADPNPADNEAVDVDALQVFAFDGLRNEGIEGREVFGGFFDDDAFPATAEEPRFLQPLGLDALFTGHAEPHTVLVVTLLDEHGATLGRHTAVTDSGGNWVANFGGTAINGQPHAIKIVQQESAINDSTAGDFNFRVYFSPSLHGQLFFSSQPDVGAVMARIPSTTLEALSQANRDPLALGWNNTSSYEFLASSSTTTQYVN